MIFSASPLSRRFGSRPVKDGVLVAAAEGERFRWVKPGRCLDAGRGLQ